MGSERDRDSHNTDDLDGADNSGVPELIALGVISKPHGIGGEVRVHCHNPDSGLLASLDQLWLRQADEQEFITVESLRPHGATLLLRLPGIIDRNGAEALRGAELCVERQNLPAVDADEYYHVDLEGLRAVDELGESLGIISSVMSYPTIDCLILEEKDGTREIPWAEPQVGEIDLDKGTVVLRHIADFDLSRRKRR